MAEVTLCQMLNAREERVKKQKEILSRFGCPLISFTMNIAGPQKTSPLIERAFYEGITILEDRIPKDSILTRHINICDTGCEAFFAASMDGKKLKDICVDIEESCSLGRLFDMDVLGADGVKYERKAMRGCIVCGAPGRACAAGRIHPVSQLWDTAHKLIGQYFADADRRRIAGLAAKSLLWEVYTTPKPGLVDKRNTGSHTDMDISTFVKSAASLPPYFCKCMAIGQETSDRPPQETFDLLRSAGLAAEETMYLATGGVNTHKGAIYSMGIICGAIGRLWTPEAPTSKTDDILSMCSQIVRDAVKTDFASIDGSTAGGRLYLEHGLAGIRGEVAAGFPSVTSYGLPAYQEGLDNALSANDAGVYALLNLIANVEDTNLYRRGGFSGACYAADSAKSLLEKGGYPSTEQIENLDDDFIARNLSPGGCADLLAVTYFLYELQKGL